VLGPHPTVGPQLGSRKNRNSRFRESVRMEIIFFVKRTTFEKNIFSFEKKIPLKKKSKNMENLESGAQLWAHRWAPPPQVGEPCLNLTLLTRNN